MEDSIQMSDAQLSGDERWKRVDGEDRRKRGLDDERNLDEESTKRILILDDKPPKRRRVVAPSPLNSNSHFTSKSDVHAPSQSHSARLSRIFERRQVILAGRTASQAEAVEDSQREMGSPRREIDGDDSELSEMVTELEEMGAEDSEFRDDKQDSDSKSEKGAEDEGEDRRSASPEEDETGKDRADEKESKETEEQQSCYRLGDGRRFYCTVPGATCKTGPFRDRYLARRHARNVHGLGGAPDVRCPIPGCRSKLHDREACKRHVEKTHPGKWRDSFQLKHVVPYAPYVRDPGAKREERLSQNKGPGPSNRESHRAKGKGKVQDESESQSDESEQEDSDPEDSEQEESDSDADLEESEQGESESDSAIHCYRRSRAGPFCTVPHCKKGPFKDASGARRHARNGHGLGAAPDVRCPIAHCTMRLQTREACKKHVRKHHVGMWRDSFVLEHLVPTDPYVRPGKSKDKGKEKDKGTGKEKDTKGQTKTKDNDPKTKDRQTNQEFAVPRSPPISFPNSTNPLANALPNPPARSTNLSIPRALPIPRPLPSGSGVRLEVRQGLPPSSLMTKTGKTAMNNNVSASSSSLHHLQSSRQSNSQSSRQPSTLFSHPPNNGSSRRSRPNFSPYTPPVAQKCPFPTCKQIFRNESTLRRHERGHDWDRCLPGGDLYVAEAGASTAVLGSSTAPLARASSSTARLGSSSAPPKYSQEGWSSEEGDDLEEDSDEEDDDAYESGPKASSKRVSLGSERSKHQHTEHEKQPTKHDMKFHCEIGSCEYQTFRRDRLERHVRTHTGEKPFECEHCEYRVAQEQNLRRHYRLHHPDKSVPSVSRV